VIGAVACALAAAFCYAFAAALQHRAAGREPEARMLDPRLLVRLLHRPLWLAGGAADVTGAGLHGAALALGPLALVQPLLVSGLILAVPLEATLDRRRPGWRDLVAVVLSAAGLGTFIAVADPQPGPIEPADAPLFGVVVSVGAFMTVLVGLALRLRPSARATVLGVATGAGYALAATLAKACVDRLVDDRFAVLADWRLYALAVVGLASVVLNQNAFQAGKLAGPLTGIVLTDPLMSIVIAVAAYQEHIASSGSALVVEAIAVAVMARGVWLVSTGRSVRTRAPGE
jgi:hypothetical protein